MRYMSLGRFEIYKKDSNKGRGEMPPLSFSGDSVFLELFKFHRDAQNSRVYRL